MKILDFGVAKVRDPDVSEARVTQQGVVFGTPEYMAPETARIGVSDPRTDIYALGMIFYEMLTGTIPFAGETAVDVMLKVVSEPVTPPRDRAPGIEITPEAEQLIMKALSKDPLRRQQSMEELLRGAAALLRVGPLSPLDRAERRRGGQPGETDQRAGLGMIGMPPGMPPGTPEVRNGPSPAAAGGSPIFLTRKKERPRRTTLPLELQADPAAMEKTPPPVVGNGVVAGSQGGHDEWSEPARPENEADWAELDIDAPDGTSGQGTLGGSLKPSRDELRAAKLRYARRDRTGNTR